MFRALERYSLAVFRFFEAAFNPIFGDRFNPWYQLGALSFYFLWVLTATGIYLFIFFDTSINGAFESVEYMTHDQWYLAGIARSVHRYASDAMALTVTLHFMREFALGRFRGTRWFSWFSGIPLLWMMFAAAIGGYWLVWDEFAQYIAVATSEWFDWLPIFSDPLARNFLSDVTLSDRLFSLLVFMHIAIPLFLLMGIFIHIKRMKLARSNPNYELAMGTLLALVVLSLIKPAVSMGPADLSQTVSNVDLDWVYLNVYPLLDTWGPGVVWAILVGISMLMAILPWMSPERKDDRRVAQVDPDNCVGCNWCYEDCPYEAISMVPHPGKKGFKLAKVDADVCTGCGICAGSCPTATPFRKVDELLPGIELPEASINDLRKECADKVTELAGENRVVIFGCDHSLNVEELCAKGMIEDPQGVSVINLPCVGALPPSFADFVARKKEVDGVFVTGCSSGDCYCRKGSEWTEERFKSERQPHLRTKAGLSKVALALTGPLEKKKLAEEITAFRQGLTAAGAPGSVESAIKLVKASAGDQQDA